MRLPLKVSAPLLVSFSFLNVYFSASNVFNPLRPDALMFSKYR